MKQDKSTTRAFHQPTLWGCTSLLAILAASHSAHAQNAPTPIPDVSVTSPAGAQPAEGSEAAGYKPDTVSNLGPLGRTPILDTPYSVNVISAPLIENMQASRPEDLYKIDPVLQTFTTSGRGYSQNFIVRGFSVANGVGTAEDGHDRKRPHDHGLISFACGFI